MSHWYRISDGQPQYTVPRSDGKGERDTNMRDGRKLGLVPSVTALLGIIDKPALTRWKINEVLEACLSCPIEFPDEFHTTEEWKRKILRLSEKKGKDAAYRGGQIHDALEHYYLGEELHPDFEDFCRPAIDLLHSKFGNVEWIPEASFSHKLGFGGKCDLHLLPCEEYPHGVIVDFKTKSAEDFSRVKAYPEQCQQLVAYREGFGMPNAQCYNLFIGTNTPGELLLHEWKEEECISAWKCFGHLVEYWKEINHFELK